MPDRATHVVLVVGVGAGVEEGDERFGAAFHRRDDERRLTSLGAREPKGCDGMDTRAGVR